MGIPTWYGIEINGGYNYLSGDKLNTGDTKGGLYNYGVTIPLAKNLWYDKRRAVLDQAKLAGKMTRCRTNYSKQRTAFRCRKYLLGMGEKIMSFKTSKEKRRT